MGELRLHFFITCFSLGSVNEFYGGVRLVTYSPWVVDVKVLPVRSTGSWGFVGWLQCVTENGLGEVAL